MFKKILASVMASVVLATGAVATTSAPASAAAVGEIVWLEKHTTSWPVQEAASWIDYYFTGSKFQVVPLGTCAANPWHRCVRVIDDWTTPARYMGATYVKDAARSGITDVYLNVNYRGANYWYKYGIVVHELGHAMGINYHNPTCVSTMHVPICAGVFNFDAAERAILWAH